MSSPPNGRKGGFKLHLFLGVLFTIVAVGVFLLVNMSNLQEFLKTRQERDQAKQENELLKEQIRILKRKQQSLASPNGEETNKQIHERLNMHLKGEKIIFFKYDNADSGTTESVETSGVETLSRAGGLETATKSSAR